MEDKKLGKVLNKVRNFLRRRLLGLALGGWLAAFISISACIFFPEIFSVVWHLRNGSVATYKHWSVSVPLGWLATEQDGLLMVYRFQRILGDDDMPIVTFNQLDRQNAAILEYEGWKQFGQKLLSKRGFQVVEVRVVEEWIQESFCVEGVHSVNRRQWQVECIVPSEQLLVSFEGHHGYLKQFFAIAQSLERTSP